MQALLHRLREHPNRQPWVTHMPARFHEDAGALASVLGHGGSLGADMQSDVTGRVWALSRDACGCREVQQALEEASDDEQRWALAAQLRGHVQEGARCPHANHVVQKCIKVMAPSISQFIIDEIMEGGDLISLSKHKYGCRIVQRLLEICPSEQVSDLVEQLLSVFLLMSKHAYGNFVVQCLLQNAARKQRIQTFGLVKQHLPELALHANGCAVICAALEHGDIGDRCMLAEMVLADSDRLAFMLGSRLGDTIVARLLDTLEGAGHQRLLALLEGNPKIEVVPQRRS